MKDEYIKKVRLCLRLPKAQRREVIRDLEEIFNSATEHGETEKAVCSRLGSPEDYAAEVQAQLDVKSYRGQTIVTALAAVVGAVCLTVAIIVMALQRNFIFPANAAGGSISSTGIELAGNGPNTAIIFLVIGIVLLVAAVVIAVRRMLRRR